MKTVTYVLLAVFIMACFSYLGSAKLTRIYIIVNMDNAPVEILEFGGYIGEEKNYISSVVQYKNKTERSIEAVAITMIYYDAFNEKEDGVRGISTDLLGPHLEFRGMWSIYGKPEFVKTAIAYVSAVRFNLSGEVWQADINEVVKAAGKLPGLEFLSETAMLEIEKK